MKLSQDEEIPHSTSLYSISLSASLPSLTSSVSDLSGSLSSSSYYSDGSSGFLSLSTTLSSIQGLQTIQNPEAYGQWPGHEDIFPLLPLVHAAPRPQPVATRLKRAFLSHRTHLLWLLEHISTWDLIVAAVFCLYLWMLLCAFAGHRRGTNGVDPALCPADFSTSLSSDPGIDLDNPSGPLLT